MATIADTNSVSVNNLVDITLTKPLTANIDDIMFVARIWPGNASSSATPATMTDITGIANPVQSGTASSDVRLSVHRHTITAASPTSWTWTITAARRQLLLWALIRGVDLNSIVNIANESGADTLTAPTITTTVASTFLLYVGAHWNSSSPAQSFTPPSGMTEAIDANASQTAGILAYQTLDVAGATGTRTATELVAGSFVACNIAFTNLIGNIRVWDGAAWATPVSKQIWSGSAWSE